ncbi:hypothetical protein V475_21295 [Sphingobium baderi LL03]|uniref:Uncharacterized protein n=1 Tax=Sphingobium baderi LL03 TaxID=1114964 RepID=T0HRY6_9SPHN|nr:hypothetical protein L485_08825 [Sphingobium baderi LL03]KMS55966.1 hypothetical protein V475_21295 [Sphingobium baderi LL03]
MPCRAAGGTGISQGFRNADAHQFIQYSLFAIQRAQTRSHHFAHRSISAGRQMALGMQ